MRTPCEKHVGAELAADGRCSKCESIRRMAYRARNLDRALTVRAAYKDRERGLARDSHAANPEPGRQRVRKYREAHPERVKESISKQYWKNPAANRERTKAWRIANPEKVLAKARAWKLENPEKAKKFRDESVRRWNAKNPGKRAGYLRQYQASKRHAVPKWANRKAMLALYVEARRLTKETGIPHHVDHVVPLNHPLVQGLHVEHNLCVIPGSANSAKGNRHWPDMPAALSA